MSEILSIEVHETRRQLTCADPSLRSNLTSPSTVRGTPPTGP
jgi:hypothetical protein